MASIKRGYKPFVSYTIVAKIVIKFLFFKKSTVFLNRKGLSFFFCYFSRKMAKQTLVFESPMELSLRDGMIVITDRSTEKTSLRSLEDIQLVMIDHHSVRISVPLVIEFSKYNIAVVFCDEKHMPVSMLMDLDSNVLQSKHFRFQLAASKPMKKQIWKQIVEAKIRNQSKLLERLGIGKSLLSPYYINVKSGDSTNREGVAARVYWTKLMGKDFIRDRYGAPPNK